jgi:hypothetical protein
LLIMQQQNERVNNDYSRKYDWWSSY